MLIDRPVTEGSQQPGLVGSETKTLGDITRVGSGLLSGEDV